MRGNPEGKRVGGDQTTSMDEQHQRMDEIFSMDRCTLTARNRKTKLKIYPSQAFAWRWNQMIIINRPERMSLCTAFLFFISL